MNCPWCDRWLQQAWEGHASPYPPPELTLHWEASPACRHRVALAARCRDVLPAATPVRPAAHFADHVLARVHRERLQSQTLAWLTTLAALFVAGAALTWLVLTTEPPPHAAPLAQHGLTPTATAPVRPKHPMELAHLRTVMEPFTEARERTYLLTKRLADQAGEKVRKLLPRWDDLELQPLEETWTVSALPVRAVSEAASSSLDPLTTSTREAYQQLKKHLPRVTKKMPPPQP